MKKIIFFILFITIIIGGIIATGFLLLLPICGGLAALIITIPGIIIVGIVTFLLSRFVYRGIANKIKKGSKEEEDNQDDDIVVIANYIKKAKIHQITKKEIEVNLLEAGWDKVDIEQGFKIVNK